MTDDQISILIRVDENVGRLLEYHGDHEKRLRNLERFKNAMAGIVAFLGSLFGYSSLHNQ